MDGCATSRWTWSCCSGRTRRRWPSGWPAAARAVTCRPSTSSTTLPRGRRSAPGTRSPPTRPCAASLSCTSPTSTRWPGTAAGAPTTVIEHGVRRPRLLLHRRRWPAWPWSSTSRCAGGGWPAPTCCRGMARHVPVDVYGMGMDALRERALADGVPSLARAARGPAAGPSCTRSSARHRAYFHPYRWTSLGLALIEAMTSACPCSPCRRPRPAEAVPPEAGLVDARPRRAAARPPGGGWTTRPRRANAAGRRGGTPSPATASNGSSTTGTGSWKEVTR